jgi:hypothetical protein
MDPTFRAEDRSAIEEVKARYFRLLDAKLWAQWRQVFSDDCRYDRTSTVASTPDAFVDTVARNLAEVRSVHHGHMPEITFTGPTSARGIWAMHDLLLWSPGATIPDFLRVDPRQTGLAGYGHYEEEYRKENGRWKISFMRLTRLALIPLTDDRIDMPGVWPPPSPDWLTPP